jgi:hypothetical protein
MNRGRVYGWLSFVAVVVVTFFVSSFTMGCAPVVGQTSAMQAVQLPGDELLPGEHDLWLNEPEAKDPPVLTEDRTFRHKRNTLFSCDEPSRGGTCHKGKLVLAE